MTFLDTKVYLIKSKYEAGSIFLKFKGEVRNQLDRKIKRSRSDRGGEYSTKTLQDFCEKDDIMHEVGATYTPQQNDVGI